MKPLADIYKRSFFGRRNSLNWRVPIVTGAALSTFNICAGAKIIDVGCATGDFVNGFREMGYMAEGIEGSPNAIPFAESGHIYYCDLRDPLPEVFSEKKYDLCMCLEVAEHIEPEYAEQLVTTLTVLADFVLVTAAGPGQGGHYHVNCQPKEYWVEKFERRKFMRSVLKESSWKQCLAPHRRKKGINAYYDNALVFRSM
jgi:hypothetical protein